MQWNLIFKELRTPRKMAEVVQGGAEAGRQQRFLKQLG